MSRLNHSLWTYFSNHAETQRIQPIQRIFFVVSFLERSGSEEMLAASCGIRQIKEEDESREAGEPGPEQSALLGTDIGLE